MKNLNDINEDYNICDLIFNKLSNLGSTIKNEYLDYALKSGCFLFLLDGYDEIKTEKQNTFFKKLDEFCDKYSKNYYVISSRPYSDFIEFQRYSVLKTQPLCKEQAISLISKIDFDKDIKEKFIEDLDNKLFEKHESFASNPLLLNIMLLTYDNYADIPEKLHLFYSNAFETLYSRHDATKSGYRREMKCNLSYDNFKKVFSHFCFITYINGKYEFTLDEFRDELKKVSNCQIKFNIDNYIFDLENSLCVIYKDGLNYKFSHRSFQEYFTAVFLKELTDQQLQNIAIQFIRKDLNRSVHDDVFNMLYDMAELRFEKNILLPLINECESKIEYGIDKYTFYIHEQNRRMIFSIMDYENEDNSIGLYISSNMNSLSTFIFEYVSYYREKTDEKIKSYNEGSKKLYNYLVKNKGYELDNDISKIIWEDEAAFKLLRETWVGDFFMTMASLKEILEEKHKEMELDLSNIML